MNAHIKVRSSPTVVKCVGRVLKGRITCANTDVVNACGGEGDGVSTILLQRSLLHNRRNTLQPDKGDHVCEMVITIHKNIRNAFNKLGVIIVRNSIRASSLTPPEWDIAIFGKYICMYWCIYTSVKL